MRTRKPRRPSAGSSAVLWRDAILGCLAIDCYACHARGDVARVGVVPRVRSTCPGVDCTTTCALRQGSLVCTRTGRLRPRLSASAVRFSTVRGAQFACAATAQVNAPANSADERSWQALTSLSLALGTLGMLQSAKLTHSQRLILRGWSPSHKA
ncbi:hypothetical protein PSPO01_13194 [Paraphaeosphaeria sporulosa]